MGYVSSIIVIVVTRIITLLLASSTPGRDTDRDLMATPKPLVQIGRTVHVLPVTFGT